MEPDQEGFRLKRFLLFLCVLAPLPALALVPEVEVQVEGGNYPIVHGTTNLPDGTGLSVTVKVLGRYGSIQNAEVSNGKFSTGTFNVEGSGPVPPGTAIIEVVSALPSMQPDSVKSVIGQNGESMTGPLIYTLPGISGRMVKATSSVSIP